MSMVSFEKDGDTGKRVEFGGKSDQEAWKRKVCPRNIALAHKNRLNMDV